MDVKTPTARCLFVFDRGDAGAAARLHRSQPDWQIVPTAKSVDSALRAAGLETVNPAELLTEQNQIDDLKRIVDALDEVDQTLSAEGTGSGRTLLVQRRILALLCSASLVRGVASKLSCAPFVMVGGTVQEWNFAWQIERTSQLFAGAGGNPPPLPFPPGFSPFGRRYAIDMRSGNYGTDPEPHMPQFVRLVLKRGMKKMPEAFFRNLIQTLRLLLGSRRWCRALILAGAPDTAPRLRDISVGDLSMLDDVERKAVQTITQATIEELDTYHSAIEKLLDRYGSNLVAALFDYPGKMFEAMIAECAGKRGIPTVTESHGSLVVHGPDHRKKAASILSRSGYNWIPGANFVAPRSPMQAFDLPDEEDIRIVRRCRVRPYAGETNRDRRFRIVLAPNFLRWNLTTPALTASCFDMHAVIAHFCELVRNRPDWELLIRVKVTTDDKPNAKQMQIDRGLVPGDIEEFFEIAPNIRNASRDSYSELMQSADLVVTEGLTAVMYEALELRKPVLLVNRSKLRVPSLPAWRHGDLENARGRNAVYAGSCEEDLDTLIDWIERNHKGKALTDAELRPYCWIDDTDGDRHHLDILFPTASNAQKG